jgi:hypothetical protein
VLYEEDLAAVSASFNYTFSNKVLFAAEGTYKVRAWAKVNDNLHNDTIEAQIIVGRASHNESNSVASKVIVYPNPSGGNFKVSVADRTNMEIINSGGVVLQRKIISGLSEFSLYTKGLYLLRFIDEKGNTTIQRLVVK